MDPFATFEYQINSAPALPPLPRVNADGSPSISMMATPATDIISRRHKEWVTNEILWRRLLDAWEGGETYRWATYGVDYKQLPIRNLIRHKSEYPDPRDPNSAAAMLIGSNINPRAYTTDDDYTLRLIRTPVPGFVEEVVETHLSKIFEQEIVRRCPETAADGRKLVHDLLEAWWKDVDGKGTSIDDWMAETVGPMLMVLGCLDVVFDHPAAPDPEAVKTIADQQRLKLDTVVAGIILPVNMVDWDLSTADRYARCVVAEIRDDGATQYREWSSTGWVLYDEGGRALKDGEHSYGRPPIRRLFDKKRPRTRNIGKPRYEGVMELQQEFYNRDSELILSDTTQAHPLLQGPEDYCKADGEVPIGPGRLLPMKALKSSGEVSGYQGFEVIEFPKDGADSIRQNKQEIRERVDRAACLTKPAGANGTTGQTVSQSGVSKRLDQSTGNSLLSKIAGILRRAECEFVELFLLVAGNGTIDEAARDAVQITYPKTFELMATDELATGITDFQGILAEAGPCPETQYHLLCRLVRLLDPGKEDDEYAEMDEEIEAYLETQAAQQTQQREGQLALTSDEMTNGNAAESEPGAAAGAATATGDPAATGLEPAQSDFYSAPVTAS